MQTTTTQTHLLGGLAHVFLWPDKQRKLTLLFALVSLMAMCTISFDVFSLICVAVISVKVTVVSWLKLQHEVHVEFIVIISPCKCSDNQLMVQLYRLQEMSFNLNAGLSLRQ